MVGEVTIHAFIWPQLIQNITEATALIRSRLDISTNYWDPFVSDVRFMIDILS